MNVKKAVSGGGPVRTEACAVKEKPNSSKRSGGCREAHTSCPSRLTLSCSPSPWPAVPSRAHRSSLIALAPVSIPSTSIPGAQYTYATPGYPDINSVSVLKRHPLSLQNEYYFYRAGVGSWRGRVPGRFAAMNVTW